MSTQRKDQSRSAKLGLETVLRREVGDDAADRIVALGFWTAATPTPGRVVALPARRRAIDAILSAHDSDL